MVAIAATANSVASRRPAGGQLPNNGKVSPRELEFLRDPSSGRVAVRSTDVATGKVRTVPPEQLLKTLAAIRRAIGLLLDSKG
jgi:uncharacterized FlaG/YvyC family protein